MNEARRALALAAAQAGNRWAAFTDEELSDLADDFDPALGIGARSARDGSPTAELVAGSSGGAPMADGHIGIGHTPVGVNAETGRIIWIPMAPTTIEEFEREYAERSGLTVDELHALGRWAEECDCDDGECDGWRMGHQWEDAIFEDRMRSRLVVHEVQPASFMLPPATLVEDTESADG